MRGMRATVVASRRCASPDRRALAWLLAYLLAWVPALPSLSPARAHEVRPALLEIEAQADGSFSVLWKVPALETGVLDLQPVLPTGCVAQGRVTSTPLPGALLQRWRIRCSRGLGPALEVRGLQRTLTSAFVRVGFADGRRVEGIATGAAPQVMLDVAAPPAAPRYLVLGVEHILLGIDHLAFVAALVLVVRGLRMLVWTLTAFTLAHSLTLGAAALGLVVLPVRPVEVLIAFSIVVVAREAWCLARDERAVTTTRASSTRATTAMARAPWVVAFGFGLLHGFGFASALAELGLPPDARAWALLLFNLGVELGQLCVLALLLPLLAWLRATWPALRSRIERAASGVLGSVATFWLLQRLLA